MEKRVFGQGEDRYWTKVTGWLAAAACAVVLVAGCGDNPRYYYRSPQGVVKEFVRRLQVEGDMRGAYELLCKSDQAMLQSNQMAYAVLTGQQLPGTDRRLQIYAKFIPEFLKMTPRVIKINPRAGKQREGYVEVVCEINYPADYMGLYGIGFRMMNNISFKLQGVDFEQISDEQLEKLAWSITNDIRKTVDNISIDKFSTYLFPVEVVDENGSWKIDLNLSSQRYPFNLP